MKIKNPQQLLQKLRKEIAEESYYQFFLQAFRVLEPETDLLANWHIEVLCNELQEAIHQLGKKEKGKVPQNIVCNVPPGATKSMIFSVTLMAWAWLHYPHMRFAVASYADFLSLQLSDKARTLIKSDWYQQNWCESGYFEEKFTKAGTKPKKFALSDTQDTKSLFQNTYGGFRVATTVGGSITGAHVDVFIGDDLLNPKTADSEALRESANNFWFKTVPSRSRNKDFFLKVLVMQRLHEQDTAGLIKEKGLKYKWIVIPAELSEDLTDEQRQEEVQPVALRVYYKDGLFFPARFSRKVLRENEKELSTLEYVGQYLQRPAPAKGNIIQPEYFLPFTINAEEGQLIKLPRYYYSDTAYGKQQSDNSATICFSVWKHNVYIWRVWKANLPFPEFIKAYKDFLVETGYTDQSICLFEPKATGSSVVQQLKTEVLKIGNKTLRINVREDKAPSDGKITRIKAQLPFIQSGGVFLLANQPWIKDFIDELIVFPNGKNDDQVDTLEGALRNRELIKSNVQISFC